jgi:hypothetical protein
MSRSKLYTIILAACCAGWVYIGIQFPLNKSGQQHDVTLCLIKQVTNVPCPSCGTTRSVLAMIKGDFVSSFQWNPLGWLVGMMMFIIPIWITFDLISKKETFMFTYQATENWFRSRWVAGPAIALVLANWAWNIYKGL